MKVLIIDDIEDSVKGIRDSCEEKGWETRLVDFGEAYSAIMEFDPDVIILDWREDTDQLDLGSPILDNIWKSTFRPVVLFSANAGIIDVSSKQNKSAMLKVYLKGDEAPVIDFLQRIERFASSLAVYRGNMSDALIASLNAVDYLCDCESIDEAAVSYVLSKRTSSFFDDCYISELSPSWVQYLCPPLSDCLNVCDIIRKISAEEHMDAVGNPEEYRLVLTPSCDMQHSQGREAKVTHVLCAQCFPKEVFHSFGLSDNPSKNHRDTVRKSLNQGYRNSMVPLPGFTNIIPFMTADLKKPELIRLNEIATSRTTITGTTAYYRVASICSPFREQIVWAHLQDSCRPGVPDRNMDLWAEEILKK